jgi:hypothetical protein
MRKILILIAFLMIGCSSDEVKKEIDLSQKTPEALVKAFFSAVGTHDVKKVESLLSPNIKKLMQEENFTLEEYCREWQGSILEIGKISEHTMPGRPERFAEFDFTFDLIGGSYKSHASLIRIDHKWYWDEK